MVVVDFRCGIRELENSNRVWGILHCKYFKEPQGIILDKSLGNDSGFIFGRLRKNLSPDDEEPSHEDYDTLLMKADFRLTCIKT